jgi:TM2 domain-containing membrane protein YozV
MPYRSDAARRTKGAMSPFNTNILQVYDPYNALWWSAAIPGAGHIMLGKMMKGTLLFIWEFTINTQSHLNQAIYFSMIGEFEAAKAIIDIRWFFLYVAIYIFVMWDSYRLATELNQFAVLADKTRAPLPAFRLNSVEINYLHRTSPWIGVAWSLFTPGLGHLVSRNIVPGLYLMLWHIVVVYRSDFMPAVFYTMAGEFALATRILDPQWLLYLPSIYLFAICDSYHRILINTRMFELEQSRYLRERYGSPDFQMPV